MHVNLRGDLRVDRFFSSLICAFQTAALMQTSSKKAAAPDYQAVRDAVADVLDVENYDDGELLFVNRISMSFKKY